jgi:hypothetical protein
MALTLLVALAIFILLAFYRASITSWVLAMLVIVPVVAIMARFSDEVLMVIGTALLFFIVQTLPKSFAADIGDRTGSDRRGNGMVGWGIVQRESGLGQVACIP